MARTLRLKQLEDLPTAAEALAGQLKHRLVLFHGAMGTGKTTLIRALCKYWQVKDEVQSPTYALVNEYRSPVVGTIYHFDWYRLKSEKEALDLGLDAYLDSPGLCLMEWPEKIRNLLPETFDLIHLERRGGERRVTIKSIDHEQA